MTQRCVTTALALLLTSSVCAAQGAAGYQVIVHLDNPEGTVSGPALSDIFLKKTVRWPSGAAIEPVNLSGEPEVSEAFARDVHHRSAANVRNYWNQQVFSGSAVQPLELASSSEVVRYVASHPGAVGYVAAGTPLDGVKALSLLLPPRVIQQVEPEYPAIARSARLSGDVVLSVAVDKSGKVSHVNVLKDLPMGLTRAAVQAVQRWRFEPASLGGKPIEQEIEVSVHFAPPQG